MEKNKLKYPVLKTILQDSSKYYCEICLNYCDKRNRKRSKIEKLDKEKFLKVSKDGKKVNHHYNEIFNRVDWTFEEMYACVPCKGMFFKEDYLQKQPVLEQIENEVLPPSSSHEIQSPTTATIRKSRRTELNYQTGKDLDTQHCIICNEVKKHKGRIIPTTTITLRSKDSKEHLAEKTLVHFARIHVEKGTALKEAAERILLVTSTKSLFVSDVCYHREECYMPFRGSGWLRSSSETSSSNTFDIPDPFDELCNLVEHHIIDK